MSFHLLYVQARVPALPLKDEGFVYLILILTPCALMVGLNHVDSCHCLGIKGFQAPENFNRRDYEAVTNYGTSLNCTTDNLLPLSPMDVYGDQKRIQQLIAEFLLIIVHFAPTEGSVELNLPRF
ncbi:Uncharacterized protein Rs2_14948 [Raphanus sativus]|nr:Uncharacterized protein Rs2_14948 [Raphanus sativus]